MDDQIEASTSKRMSTLSTKHDQVSNLESELYLLIVKFLSTGLCQKAAEVLKSEIEEHQLLPKRIDWLGGKHDRSFIEIEHILSQVSDDYLLKVCQKINVLDKEISPTTSSLQSLIGGGKQSLVRSKEDFNRSRVNDNFLLARKYGVPFLTPPAIQSYYPPNITKVLLSREVSGPITSRHIFSTKTYARLQPFRRFLGHLSSVYCVLFDRTGKYIFTGADDLLVKIWSALDGRLLASLRGHSAEITDMAVNYENTLLAAGSCDKTIRVWCVRTTAPVAVLCGHTAMVTSIQFCPYPKTDENYLVSTGNDGCVCFWPWKNNTFNPKPIKFTERNRAGAQMICSSFSQGGIFLATGSTDHNVRVYNMSGSLGPEKILEKEIHTDRVDSLQFSNRDCRFISGSKDGTAQIWKYAKQNWQCITLKMTTKLAGNQQEETQEDSKLKLRVTMVGWSLDDRMVITAVSDHSVKVWDSFVGTLCFILKGHEDEVFVLESHPLDARVLLSSGHDGRINLWDLNTGTVIKSHFNLIEGQGHGAVFDCKFSPDGQMFAATDSHGHLSIFGLGATDRYKKVPAEVFFHTDYRPLIRDINHHVLDEQTQTPPHLLPPPFLVDIDGNPYPPNLQRLVPGRGHCNDSQLIPYVAVSAAGDPEILEPVLRPPEGIDRPTIDDMIERLQQEQERAPVGSPTRSNHEQESNNSTFSPRSDQRSPRISTSERNGPEAYSPRSAQRTPSGHSRVGMRRTGDIEGVRQSVGNWQSRGNQVEVPSWVKRVVVKPMSASLAESRYKQRLYLAESELAFYNAEKRKRFESSHDRTSEGSFRKEDNRLNNRNRNQEHSYSRTSNQTRAGRVTRNSRALTDEFVADFPENQSSSSGSETETEQRNLWDVSTAEEDESNISGSGSGNDSDWIASKKGDGDKPNLRSSKPSAPNAAGPSRRRRRHIPCPSDANDDEENDDEDTEEQDEDEEYSRSKGKRKPKRIKKKKYKLKDNNEPGPSTSIEKKKPISMKKLPERYRPPEWLTDVIPHKVPYVPQIGDEVVYFRQGHELYVQAVRRNKIYEIYMRNQPWRQLKQLNLRDQEVAKIIHMSFEDHVPRLCCLKLELLNPVDEDDRYFTIKYHDMPDVVDFLVLKQYYDQSMQYNWKPGDRFRSAIDKAWWLGIIKSQKPYNENYPDSPFQCFIVKWDNGEKECMSPWDFEPIDLERMPDDLGGSVDITPEEKQAMMYCPGRLEWSSFGQDYDIDRIVRGLNKISELSLSEAFIEPVDLLKYPSYAMHVAYPIDLGTIKARLENRFYRRLDAVKFDLEYIKINAIKFNEPESRIVKQAKCLVTLCMKFFNSVGCEDPMDFYNEMLEAKHSRSQDSQSELDVLRSESDLDTEYTTSTRLKRKKRRECMMRSNKRQKLESQKYTSESWKIQCTNLLNEIIQLDDSTPFRVPVSLIEYPDYRNIIDCPMDLSTSKEKMETNQYFSPIEFCKDMRLIFQNSRTFNVNKKSKIYSMTIRLSATFEERIRSIVSDWKSVVKYEEKLQNNQFVSSRRKPFSLVGAELSRVMRMPKYSNHRNDQNSDEFSQPGPSSTRNHSIQSAKYDDSSSSQNSVVNGIMKNSNVKTMKPKPGKKQKLINVSVKRGMNMKQVKNKSQSESEEEESDQNKTSSDASSQPDDDDEDYEVNGRKTNDHKKRFTSRRLRMNLKTQIHRFNTRSQIHNTRSSIKQQKKASIVSRYLRKAQAKPKTQSRTSPPNVYLRPRRAPPLATRSSRLSTLRDRQKFPQRRILSSAGSESDESYNTSKRKRNSTSSSSSKSKNNSSNSSKSENESGKDEEEEVAASQNTSSNDFTESEDHSNSEKDEDETTSPDTDTGVRRSSRATTRDSTKATSSAFQDSRQVRRRNQSSRIMTRNCGQRTVRYLEVTDDEFYNHQNTDDEQPQNSYTSSRGRLRRDKVWKNYRTY